MVTVIRISTNWRLAVVVALVCVRPSPASAQLASEAQVRAEVEAGAYERAEQLARARVLELTPRLGQSAPEVRAGEQLLVETLILNGRGAQRTTLDLARRLAQPTVDGGLPPVQSVVALGHALVAAAEYGESVKVLTAALSAVQNPVSSDPGARAAVQHHLGRALVYDGRSAEALTLLQRSLAYRRDHGAAGPLADTLLAVAWAHQRSRELHRRRRGHPRGAPPSRIDTGPSRVCRRAQPVWPSTVVRRGHSSAARDTSATAVAVAERTVRLDHPILALALMRLGATVLDLGDVAESLLIKQRALAMAERTFGPAHYETWAYINGLAEGLRRNGDYTAARAQYLRALAIAEGRFGTTHDSVATTVHNLALVDARLGDYARARSEQVRATGIWERLLGPDHPFVAVALTELAAVYRAQGGAGEALPMLRRALRIRNRSLGPLHRDVAKTLADVAAAYLDLDRLAEADTAIRRALEIWGTTAGPETPDLAAMCDLMARIQAARGQLSDAQAYYERALTIWNTSVGRLHPAYAEAQAGLATTLARLGRFDAAGTAAAEAEDAGRTHLRLMIRVAARTSGAPLRGHAPGRPRRAVVAGVGVAIRRRAWLRPAGTKPGPGLRRDDVPSRDGRHESRGSRALRPLDLAPEAAGKPGREWPRHHIAARVRVAARRHAQGNRSARDRAGRSKRAVQNGAGRRSDRFFRLAGAARCGRTVDLLRETCPQLVCPVGRRGTGSRAVPVPRTGTSPSS